MTDPLEPHDVLIAVADPRGTAALALADELNAAWERVSRAEEAFQEAQAAETGDPQVWDRRYKQARALHDELTKAAMVVQARFDQLLDGVDDDLYVRIEEVVFRDRTVEQAWITRARNRDAEEATNA
jgi:hypothetical protein